MVQLRAASGKAKQTEAAGSPCCASSTPPTSSNQCPSQCQNHCLARDAQLCLLSLLCPICFVALAKTPSKSKSVLTLLSQTRGQSMFLFQPVIWKHQSSWDSSVANSGSKTEILSKCQLSAQRAELCARPLQLQQEMLQDRPPSAHFPPGAA